MYVVYMLQIPCIYCSWFRTSSKRMEHEFDCRSVIHRECFAELEQEPAGDHMLEFQRALTVTTDPAMGSTEMDRLDDADSCRTNNNVTSLRGRSV